MELWIIQKGKKEGPFNDYEIRDRIESGELGPETRVWHEGAEGWIRIAEVEIFRSEFEGRMEESEAAPPPLPNPPRPFLRFLARWFDHFLYMLLLFALMVALGMDLVAAVMSPLFLFLHMLPWVALEAIAIHLWRTTPGKWLLGLQVQMRDGSRLGLGASLVRAFRVFVLGMGMKMSFFLLIAHGFGLWFLLRFGEAPWDKMARAETRHSGLETWRIVGFVAGGFAIVTVLALLFQPVSVEVEKEMRELFPWFSEMFPEPSDSGA
jgi:uncharacterized RDD family membrane protein YckC